MKTKTELNRYNKLWRLKHKKSISNSNDKYRQKHKIEAKKYQKLYRIKNKKILAEKKKIYMKKYNKLHKKQYRKWQKMRLKKNVIYKLSRYLRSRIWSALKGIDKSNNTKKLLGCDIEFFKTYLESKFKKGMSWKNYGYYGWHIDHIKGCVNFDLKKKSEQYKCFNYKNLQPLWWYDNLRKKR